MPLLRRRNSRSVSDIRRKALARHHRRMQPAARASSHSRTFAIDTHLTKQAAVPLHRRKLHRGTRTPRCRPPAKCQVRSAKSRKAENKTESRKPATGVWAPERIFVAVRAIAPAAGSPPNSGESMLATPWARSSTFGLCLSPVMRSDTTADISDSMAPSMATVMARDIKGCSRSMRNWGTLSVGRPDGMPPERVPIVSTGSLKMTTAAVPRNRATM
jgi:hypothetical protein